MDGIGSFWLVFEAIDGALIYKAYEQTAIFHDAFTIVFALVREPSPLPVVNSILVPKYIYCHCVPLIHGLTILAKC